MKEVRPYHFEYIKDSEPSGVVLTPRERIIAQKILNALVEIKQILNDGWQTYKTEEAETILEQSKAQPLSIVTRKIFERDNIRRQDNLETYSKAEKDLTLLDAIKSNTYPDYIRYQKVIDLMEYMDTEERAKRIKTSQCW